MRDKPVLATHSGKFHADDVLAYAMLKAAFGLRCAGEDHVLVRTRDPLVVARADVAWDVGFEHDPGRMRFDHHQRDRLLRQDGIPYSAAGLVWRTFGEAICRNLLGEDMEDVRSDFDREVVQVIDAQDNGYASSENTLDLSHMVEDLNPAWDGHEDADTQFLAAAGMAEAFMRARLSRLASRHAAAALVEEAVRRAEDPRVIELPQGIPWQGAVRAMGAAQVAYAVFPTSAGTWAIDAMPADGDPLGQRAPLPEEWGGLEAGELQRASGVADAVFVHAKRFCGAAGSRRGAMEMAGRSLDLLARPAVPQP